MAQYVTTLHEIVNPEHRIVEVAGDTHVTELRFLGLIQRGLHGQFVRTRHLNTPEVVIIPGTASVKSYQKRVPQLPFNMCIMFDNNL